MKFYVRAGRHTTVRVGVLGGLMLGLFAPVAWCIRLEMRAAVWMCRLAWHVGVLPLRFGPAVARATAARRRNSS